MSLTQPATVKADTLPRAVPHGACGVVKRLADIGVSASLLLFVLPLFVVIAAAIRLRDGGPVIYRHERYGADGQRFMLHKFRTMRLDADDVLNRLLQDDEDAQQQWTTFRKLKHDPRVTATGRWLRRSSLDELPQLLNVLLGEMSLVGPRPVMADELERYGDMRVAYHAVRPGITGLWQVSGRNTTDFDRRIHLDVAYVSQWSFLLDLKILLKTIPAVLFAKGAY